MQALRTRFLVCVSTVALAGAVGLAAAGPVKPKKNGPSMAPGVDSVQVTVVAGKGRLGLEVLQISDELRGVYGAPTDRGVLVNAVRGDSPAARAGVKVGDVVVEVDGDAARSASDMMDAMSDRKRGDAVPIVVMRDHKRTTLRATLDDDPGAQVLGGNLDGLDPQFQQWFQGFPDARGFMSGDVQRRLEEALRRIDDLERRIDDLERT